MFKYLPTDVIFNILEHLTVEETESLIAGLNQIDHHQLSVNGEELNHDLKFLTELIILSYQRIYRGNFTIYSNLDSNNPSIFDKAMTFQDFHKTLYDDPTSQDAFKTSLDKSVENKTFTNTRSKYIEFVFIRQPNDYRQFVRDLSEFSSMIEQKDCRIFKYLNSVLQYGLYINGNCVAIEPTTSFLVSILKVLIAISGEPELFSQKFTRVSIKSTDIGQYYINQWCKLFSRFSNTKYLDLSDNLIKSDEHVYEFTPSVDHDLLGKHFEWPPKLKYLSLNKNFLSYISSSFITNLPKSLEVLILSNNWLSTIGQVESEKFELFTELPNLNMLSLCDNTALIYVNPDTFRGVNKNFKTLRLKGCNLSDDNLSQLGIIAKRQGFVIEI